MVWIFCIVRAPVNKEKYLASKNIIAFRNFLLIYIYVSSETRLGFFKSPISYITQIWQKNNLLDVKFKWLKR